MKPYNYKWLLLHSALLLFIAGGCKKDNALNLTVSSVSALYFPETNKYIKLQPATTAAVNFEWSNAKAQDGSLVMYEVAFDKADGDFSKPLYTVASNKNGVENSLSLSHKILNKIAKMAGIDPLSSGTIRWTVLSSKGTNVVKADSARTLVVERPAGIEPPDNVYITGTATEGGEDLANAIPMKLSDGIFEVFTKLKPGTYSFTDRNSGTPVTYSIEGNTMKEGGTNSQSSEGTYRVRLDFTNATAELLEVTKVGIYASAWNTTVGTLLYRGKGVWQGEQIAIAFYDFGSWKDDRFKFCINTKDNGGNQATMYYGSANASNSAVPDATTPASYYKVIPVDNSQWDFTYKYPANANGKNIDVILDLSTTKPDYSYSLSVK